MQPKPALNPIKDSFELRSCPREDICKGNRNLKCNNLESFIGSGAYNKESFGGLISNFQEVSPFQFFSQYAGSHVNLNKRRLSPGGRVEDSPQFHGRDINTAASSKEISLPSIITTANVSASFEFHVNSEEGIKLCVDLDSSPSEWIKKYKNQVSFCDNVVNTKSRSLYEELGCIGESNKKLKSSVLQNIDSGQNRDRSVQAEPSPGSVGETNSHVRNGHPDGNNNSLISSAVIPCDVAVDVSLSLKEDPGLASAKPSSDGQNHKNFSNTESFVVKRNHIALIHQNSKWDDEVCENSTQQKSCNLENASVVFPGCFMEMQLSETGNYHKDASCLPHKNGKFFDPYDSKHNTGSEQDGHANSSENDHCKNQVSTSYVEQEWSNAINGRESSVCSQVDDSFDKTSLNSGIIKSSEELLRKRPHIYRVSQNGRRKSNTIILRSTRRSAGKVLPRRSMRLVSK
ncbi:hypothetical protein OIU77_002994 [Salix suchowensis]|uniref:Uncharacterized protein n=1 Tax=Salix suchowensis TaxID=1278906 RepID=A0ABQ9AY45_9ROSI|nr:hypothetical protein OIU77_002994 [Salix suchowensis]